MTRAFVDSGAFVVGSSRSISDSDFVSERFAGIPSDLTKAEDAMRLAAAAVERCGSIDVLVHVAGGFAYGGPIQETSEAVWDQMMDVNARAAFHVLRAVIPHMRQRKSGRIVAIGSRAGVEPAANIAAYAASKAALVSLVHTAALRSRPRNHGECDSARHHRYRSQSAIRPESGPLEMGIAAGDRQTGRVSGLRCREPDLRARPYRFMGPDYSRLFPGMTYQAL